MADSFMLSEVSLGASDPRFAFITIASLPPVAAGPDLAQTLPLFSDRVSFINDPILTPSLESRLNKVIDSCNTAASRIRSLERATSILCSTSDSLSQSASLEIASSAALALADSLLKDIPQGFIDRTLFVSGVIKDALKFQHDAMLNLATHRRVTADHMIANMMGTISSYFSAMRVASSPTPLSDNEVLAINESESSMLRRTKLSCDIILLWYDNRLASGRTELAAEIAEAEILLKAAVSRLQSLDPRFQIKNDLASIMAASYVLPIEFTATDPWDSKTSERDSLTIERFNRHEAGRVERASFNGSTPGRKRVWVDNQNQVSSALPSRSRDSPSSPQSFGSGRVDPRVISTPQGSPAGNSPSHMYSPAAPHPFRRHQAPSSSSSLHR